MQLSEQHYIIEQKVKSHFRDVSNAYLRGVIVVDGICGIGKTTEAMEDMQKLILANKNNRVIYVSPYLDELHRVAGTIRDSKSLEGRPLMNSNKEPIYKKDAIIGKFKHPYNKSGKGKLSHLKELIRQSENIVITHSLFSKLDNEIIKLVKQHYYHLIIDEEPCVIEPIEERYTIDFNDSDGNTKTIDKLTLQQHNISELENAKIIKVNPTTGNVIWIGPSLIRYEDIEHDIKNNHIHSFIRNKTNNFIWRYNPDVFHSFRSVKLLTYLFRDSIFNAYLEINKIPYIIQDLTEESLFDINPITKQQILKPLHDLINLHKPKKDCLTQLNAPGGGLHAPLSSAYFDTFLRDKQLCETSPLKSSLISFFKSKPPQPYTTAVGINFMWTTVKKASDALAEDGYRHRIVSFNIRASNNYRDSFLLAFCYNPHLHPDYKTYFKRKGAHISEDSYATSILIQWIFRSAIRDGNPIKVFVPAPRMANLLEKWINKYRNAYMDRMEVRDKSRNDILQDEIQTTQPITDVNFFVLQPGLKHLNNIRAFF